MKLYVAPSAVSGDGLFTDADVPVGQILTTGITPWLFGLGGTITPFG